jgi:hypothetical protein
MDQTNAEMAGGHCFGFSVTAELFWQDNLNTTTFGAPASSRLAIDDNAVMWSLRPPGPPDREEQ